MERAVRTSGNQGPKGQRAKGPNCRHESLESLESLVPDSSFASSLYSNLYRFFTHTILGLKTDMEFMIFMTLGSEMQCEQCEIDRSTLQYSAVAVV